MSQDSTAVSSAAHAAEPLVAVFDTQIMALRAVAALNDAKFTDSWLAIVRGESDDGHTIVRDDAGNELFLYQTLTARGTLPEHAHRFDGILPPGTAVLALHPGAKFDDALRIIEVVGGHIEY